MFSLLALMVVPPLRLMPHFLLCFLTVWSDSPHLHRHRRMQLSLHLLTRSRNHYHTLVGIIPADLLPVLGRMPVFLLRWELTLGFQVVNGWA